ncbi:MAG: hypothetical protein WBW16_05890 [Bacteroidota bacterium]
MRIKKEIRFILPGLLFFVTAAWGQNKGAYKYVRIDTTKVISQTELVKIADRFLKRYYAGIFDLKEKAYVDAQFKLFDTAKESRLKIGWLTREEKVLIR